MNWPTGRTTREFKPNGEAVVIYRLSAGTSFKRAVEPVRITPKFITTRRGDRFARDTGRCLSLSFMQRARWLLSVTPRGEPTRIFANPTPTELEAD